MIPLYKTTKQKFATFWRNRKGWKTKRKIVVLESDDWGSTRMPSRSVYEELVGIGYQLESRPFEKYDSLETESDIILLTEVLSKYVDKNGRHPIITANTIMTNPDFKKIKESNYEKYYSEFFFDTYVRTQGHKRTWNAFQNGIKSGILFPQFHGTTHFNQFKWLKALQSEDATVIDAFQYELVGLPNKHNINAGNRLLVSLEISDLQETELANMHMVEGLQFFEKTFKFKSKSFIAPVYTWHPTLEPLLAENGVQFIQGSRVQLSPILGTEKLKKIYHYTGENNRFGQSYLVRNVYFEPSADATLSLVDNTLCEIKRLFSAGYPAVVSSHRLNYIGTIHPENRERNLILLNDLLKSIVNEWPDVEFLSSVQLGKSIVTEKSL